MTNIILCGGSGTRLWPLSRDLYPKQFVDMIDGESLFEKTFQRNSAFCDDFLVVTNQRLHFMAFDQVANMPVQGSVSYLLEPVGRNTAPAIAIAAFDLAPDEMILVTPSDHLIGDLDEYEARIRLAESLAREDRLVTFGIKPGYPETGYGYIEASSNELGEGAFSIASFKEKPDKDTAEAYLAKGNFLWNSGMFVFKAGTFLDELKKHSPEIYEASKKAYDAINEREVEGARTLFIGEDEMNAIPADSIDYAVMEKTDLGAVVSSSFKWNDLGSFDSLYEIMSKDESGNTFASDHINIDSKNNLVIGSGRKVATIDIEDSIIIDTEDALMIARQGSSQKVKEVVNRLKSDQKSKELTQVHVTAFRPWGSYTVLEDSENFKIKRIVVKPGHRLSLQKHMHRSEHWVVVSGTATVQVGDKVSLVRKNESTYIPIGEIHRLHNEGHIPLAIIETQVGEYLGEDDIIRLEDDYKRE